VSPVLLGLMAYVAAQLAVGLVVARGVRTESDYLIAGRRLGPWTAVLSIFATWFGAETCLGAAGSVYSSGISGATADPFGYAACLLLMGAVFAAPLWRRKLSTLADLFRLRFSPGVERLVAVLMVPTSLLWAAAQVRGFGQVVAATSEVSVETAIVIGACLAVAYTAAGGLLADALTDLVQGLVLILGLLLLAFFALTSNAHHVAPAFAAVPHPPSVLSRLESWSVPIVGSLWAQELGARILSCRSERLARNATLGAGVLYLAVGSIPLMLGLLGPSILPGLAHPEQLLPRLAQHYLPTWAYVIFAGALISAILSTVDSALLSAASLTSHNLLASLHPEASDRTRLRMARGSVAVFGVVTAGLALNSNGIYELVESASSFGSAGLLVAGSFGLFTRFGGPLSASMSLCVGTIAWLGGEFVFEIEAPYLTALAAALLGYIALALTVERDFVPSEITPPN